MTLETVDRIIRMTELTKLISLARSTIYDKLNAKSPRHDPSFPRAVKLGASAIGWRQSEVNQWIATRSQSSQTMEVKNESTQSH
ncbi:MULTISPECIES: helix-turn-helix transcriptional regulator [Aeromonas]|uniref:AlpA family phage regulatory protein n=1 Tax=Aeromonas caviae TaxID=648 RepID=A0AA42V831_AERCA|nr:MULTISPECIES: AlpA family phage regulatory protein [Aeromonas]MDH1896275.1 AlpA family phage regulatory protein [Aeromonas caviae]